MDSGSLENVKKEIEACILAGGIGYEFQEGMPKKYTEPKPLATVGARRIIDFSIKADIQAGLKVNVLTRDYEINKRVVAYVKEEFPHTAIWNFEPETTRAYYFKILSNPSESDLKMRLRQYGSNGTKYLLKQDANSVYPMELIEQVIKNAYEHFQRNSNVSAILYMTKVAPQNFAKWKIDSGKPVEKKLIEYKEKGVIASQILFRKNAISNLPPEAIPQKEKEGWLGNEFLGSTEHLASLLEQNGGEVIFENFADYTVGHMDKPEHQKDIEVLVSGKGFEWIQQKDLKKFMANPAPEKDESIKPPLDERLKEKEEKKI